MCIRDRLYDLIQHYRKTEQFDRFKNMPIYVDSPLAKEATKLFKQDAHYLIPSIKAMVDKKVDPFSAKNITFVGDMKDSVRLSKDKTPKVIISSSGMCQGGRILGHLKETIESEQTTLIFVGYQGEWTIGRQLLEKKETVVINDKEYSPKCKIIKLSGFSGHGDRIMIKNWLASIKNKEQIFITHGEEDAREALQTYIDGLAPCITIPMRNTTIEIED